MSRLLRRLMDDRGVSQIELSGIADVSQSTISLYLRGRRGTRINSQAAPTVRKLAKALGVSPTVFDEYRIYRIETLMRRHRGLLSTIEEVALPIAQRSGWLAEFGGEEVDGAK